MLTTFHRQFPCRLNSGDPPGTSDGRRLAERSNERGKTEAEGKCSRTKSVPIASAETIIVGTSEEEAAVRIGPSSLLYVYLFL